MTFLDYAARGKTTWWRWLVTGICGFAGGMALTAAGMATLMACGVPPADLTRELTSPSRPTMFFPLVGLVFGALLLGYVGAVRLLQAKRFGDIIGSWRWRAFGLGAGLWLGVQLLATLIDYATTPGDFRVTASAATGVLAVAALFGLAIQTFMEEFIFRGIVTQAILLATRRPMVTAMISGAVFGALHIPNGTPQALEATAFGVVTALIAVRTGGLAFGWGLHLVNNLYGAVVVVSTHDVFQGAPGLLTFIGPVRLGWDSVLAVSTLLFALWVATRRWSKGDGVANGRAVEAEPGGI